jgi:DNA topoisomerase-2
MRKAEAEGLEKRFKTFTTISTNNMVCFDSENRIKRYENAEEILRDFYNIRLVYYQRRKVTSLSEYNAGCDLLTYLCN